MISDQTSSPAKSPLFHKPRNPPGQALLTPIADPSQCSANVGQEGLRWQRRQFWITNSDFNQRETGHKHLGRINPLAAF